MSILAFTIRGSPFRSVNGRCNPVVSSFPADVNQNTWFVAVFSGWGGAPNGLGGLYKTVNRGATWIKLTGSQFDRVTSITFNPQNIDQVYLTTETQGLWITNDINAGAPIWTLENSYPFRQPERVFFNPHNQDEMWVTSFGNGMKVGLLNSLGLKESADENDQIKVYPNPFHDQVCFSNLNKIQILVKVNIYDIQGKAVISEKVKTKCIATTSLKPGIYLMEFTFDDNSRVYKKIAKFADKE